MKPQRATTVIREIFLLLKTDMTSTDWATTASENFLARLELSFFGGRRKELMSLVDRGCGVGKRNFVPNLGEHEPLYTTCLFFVCFIS